MKFLFKCLNSIAFIFFLLPALAWAGAAKIEKVGVGSAVKVNRGGVTLKLKEGDVLESGDELYTDPNTAVDLRLDDDSLIRIGVNSSYKVLQDSKLNSWVHRLLSGVVRVLVTPSEKDGKPGLIKFRMSTPEGTIGVRGTEFVVVRSEGKTELKGLDGNVLFGSLDSDLSQTGNFVEVKRGFSSYILAGKKVSAAPEKFDLRSYLNSINSKAGPFAPLAGRMGGEARRFTRDSGVPPPVGSIASGAPPSVPRGLGEDSSKKKGDPKQRVDYQGMLLEAAQDGDIEKAKTALENGAQINGKGGLGYTPLQIAFVNDKLDMFAFLIGEGANVEMENEEGLTPLMLVAREGGKNALKYAEILISPGGADYKRESEEGMTAADFAEEKGHKELTAYFSSKRIEGDYQEALQEKESRKKEVEGAQGKTKAPKKVRKRK